MRGHWAPIHPVLRGLAGTRIQEACWRSFLQGFGGVPFLPLCTKEQTAVLLVNFCPPTVHTTPTGSTGLSPGISCTLLTLCWETKQTFWQQHIWMCHLGGAAQPEQLMWAADNALCYYWWWGLWKNAKLAKNQSDRMQRGMVCGHHLQDQALIWSANCHCFLPQMIRMIISSSLTDWGTLWWSNGTQHFRTWSKPTRQSDDTIAK